MSNKSFRVKYDINNNEDKFINVKLDRSYKFFELLSLKINQEDFYNFHTSDYGVVVGRVIANDGFGVPNAKVSIFIPNDNAKDKTLEKNIIYPFAKISDRDAKGIRYNLLPSEKRFKCHQNVGTFPTKRDVLDNPSYIEIFDDYYKYTTTTNTAGDYMIFGVPVGQQHIHVDIDLSDIGVLSQTPVDMMYKGFNLKQFDGPSKFKKSTNLDSLPQIISEDTTVYVYPFWGDEQEGEEIAITKKSINIQYKFEPTCIFMGSIMTDSENGGVNKNCNPGSNSGKMKEMVTSKGTIEMIRKTVEGKIEKYSIEGDRLINGDGVWCYQIPMNLDYVITDELGNLVPATDTLKGIPTRTEVRFRIGLDSHGGMFAQKKTAKYLIPHIPKSKEQEDYEFGTLTKDSSFVNLMWNNVYSIKNYIPRIQKYTRNVNRRKFTGIKAINYHENNNPTPYNNIWVDLNFRYRLMCFLMKLTYRLIYVINNVIYWLHDIGTPFRALRKIDYITIDPEMVGDCGEWDSRIETLKNSGYDRIVIGKHYRMQRYVTGKASGMEQMFKGEKILISTKEESGTVTANGDFIDKIEGYMAITKSVIMECNQTALAIDYEVVNFDFNNDWVNGMLYAPKYIAKVKKKRKHNQLSETYCGSKPISFWGFNTLNLLHSCAVEIDDTGEMISSNTEHCERDKDMDCHKQKQSKKIKDGIIVKNNDEYYYRAAEIGSGSTYFFPTGVILLGSLNENNIEGIPQFFKYLPQTTFQLPPQQAEFDYDLIKIDGEDDFKNMGNFSNRPIGFVFLAKDKGIYYTKTANGWDKGKEYKVGLSRSGIDWGRGHIEKEERKKGLFLGLTCSKSYTIIKSCINAIRMCELGVEFDERYEIEELGKEVFVDGYISKEEIGDGNARAMFATINYGNLKVVKDKYGQFKYDFSTYNDPTSFDNRMVESTGSNRRVNNIDKSNTEGVILYNKDRAVDYSKFRYGNKNAVDYTNPGDNMNSFIRYENSFYFYFGLNAGSTAIDIFNEQYFSPCEDENENNIYIGYEIIRRDSMFNDNRGKLKIILDNLVLPYKITITDKDGKNIDYEVQDNKKEIIVDNIPEGDYTVTVIDSNNDTASSKMVMVGTPKIVYDIKVFNPSDVDDNDGNITISSVMAGGDVIDYSYIIRSLNSSMGEIRGDVNAGRAVTLTDFGVGVYEVIVKYRGVNDEQGVLTLVNLGAVPRVFTNEVFTVGYSSIYCSFKVDNNGGSQIRENGIEYSRNRDMSESLFAESFDLTISSNTDKKVGLLNLDDNIPYYFRGYAVNDIGIGYGGTVSTTTLQQPKLILYTNSISPTRIQCAIEFPDANLDTSEIGIAYDKFKVPNLRNSTYTELFKFNNDSDKNNALLHEFEVLSTDADGTEYFFVAYVISNGIIYESNVIIETKGNM